MYRAVVGGVMLLALLTPLVAKSRVIKITPPTKQFRAIAMVVDDWAGYSLLKIIAACESTGNANKEPRQFLPDGSVLWGNDPETGKSIKRDEGILQINTYVWKPLADSMSDDLSTKIGNIAFGKYLFNKYGSDPWTPSRGCWGRYAQN